MRMISAMKAAGMLAALRQSSGVEIWHITPLAGGVWFGFVWNPREEVFGGGVTDCFGEPLRMLQVKDGRMLPADGLCEVWLFDAEDGSGLIV